MSSNEVAPITPNPFESWGNAATGNRFVGDLLKFNKGDYIAGQEAAEIPVGAKVVAIMYLLMIGWVKWENNSPVDHQMGRLVDGFTPARRADLGDDDENEWEVDDNGKPRDPWRLTNYLPMVSYDPESPEPLPVFTFTTSSKGGLGAIGELCKIYGRGVRANPDAYPIVQLDVGSYSHANKSFGRIKFPKFTVTGWASKGDYDRAIEAHGSDGGDDGAGGAAAALPPPPVKTEAVAAKPQVAKTTKATKPKATGRL